MKIDIISLFPEFFDAFFSHSIIKRAIEAGRLDMAVTKTRGFCHNKKGERDGKPHGGGGGEGWGGGVAGGGGGGVVEGGRERWLRGLQDGKNRWNSEQTEQIQKLHQ